MAMGMVHNCASGNSVSKLAREPPQKKQGGTTNLVMNLKGLQAIRTLPTLVYTKSVLYLQQSRRQRLLNVGARPQTHQKACLRPVPPPRRPPASICTGERTWSHRRRRPWQGRAGSTIPSLQ